MAEKADMRPLTKVLTHVNEQTFTADAGVIMHEVIDTPGYGGDFMLSNKKERAACLLLAARVFRGAVTNESLLAASSWINSQITQGDHSGDANMSALTEADLLMLGHLELHASSNPFFPMELESPQVSPLVITQKFTISHRGSNTTACSSKLFAMVLNYQIVAVSTEKYADMLLTQQRTS